MLQEEVLKHFKRIFPPFSTQMTEWFPNGRNSVRVRVKSGSDFIFTYHSESDWCLETVDAFVKRLKGANRMEC